MLKWLRNKKNKHLLPSDFKANIDTDALKIVATLQKNGFESYIVGGCVRDLFLEKHPKDFDIATSASPQKVKNLIQRSFIIGKRFRIVIAKRRLSSDPSKSNKLFPPIIRGGKISEKEIEITTFRRKPEMQGDKINENVFGTAKDDAFRRDFTVNGLFLDPHSGKIVDHVGGIDDLKAKKLRIIGDPYERFHEDPIRILRAIRFCARSHFTLESKTESVLKKEISSLSKTKPERVREEILKFLKEGIAGKAFRWLWELGAWKYLSPTWTKFLETHPEQREYFFRACEKIQAQDWHQSFGAAPLFYIFLLPLTTLSRDQAPLINQVLKATADELKISKIEKEEIQFLHRSLKALLQNPNEGFVLAKKTSFVLKQLQFTLTLSILKDIDPKQWSNIWKQHEVRWLDHLEWLLPKLQEEIDSGAKRPSRKSRGRKPSYSSKNPSKNRGHSPSTSSSGPESKSMKKSRPKALSFPISHSGKGPKKNTP